MHMSQRIHVVLDDRERAAFQARAEAEGRSLSEWLRLAARDRLEQVRPARISTLDDLTSFFGACDLRETGREPEWAEHLAVAERSRGASVERT
jgi:hypothetical protein